jgi:hypothetical protein
MIGIRNLHPGKLRPGTEIVGSGSQRRPGEACLNPAAGRATISE